MRSIIRCFVCSTCLTLLVSPDSAGGSLGRALVFSLRRVQFSFLIKMSQASIGTHRYISISVYLYNEWSGVAGRSLSLRLRRPWFESRMAFLLCALFTSFFGSSVKICTMMIEVLSEQPRSQFYMHTEYCCCAVLCLSLIHI